jgi:DNA mismatch repair protein MutH
LKTFKQLLDRLVDVQGVPFEELAKAHGIEWHEEPVRNKGLTGRIVETALGKEPDSRAEVDLTDLGVEVKSIPIKEELVPREHTKVTTLNFADVAAQRWENSTVFHKLRNILFVPIVKYDLERPDQWYIRSPFIWMPSIEAQRELNADYDAVRALIKAHRPDELTSRKPPEGICVSLIPNTGGRDSNDTVTFEIDGESFTVRRRSWMLRKDFTARILRENMEYQPE